MKKIFSLLVSLLIIVTSCFCLASCKPPKEQVEHVHSWKETDVDGYKVMTCDGCDLKSLPMINIQVNGRELTKEYVDCAIWVSSGNDEYDIVGVEAEVKVRGNGSAEEDKKPYRIKFKSKQKMLGLNNDLSAKSWVLLAEFSDKTIFKNATAFYLGKEILGVDGYYVSDYRFVSVFVDNVYQGVYLLAEQQQVNKGRVNVNEPTKNYTDTDIGYFVEMDGYAEQEDYWFATQYGQLTYLDGRVVPNENLMDKYTVKSDIYSGAQLEYVRKAVQNIWNVMYDAAYGDHGSGQPYKTLDENNNLVDDLSIATAKQAVCNWVDVQSLVDTFIHAELCEDIDIGWSSFFMSIDFSSAGNKKLTFQAPWDFDLAFGANAYKLDELYACTKPLSYAIYTNPWLVVLAKEDWFMQAVAAKWQQIRDNGVIEKALYQITLCTSLYQTDFANNFNKWKSCLSTEWNPHQSAQYQHATTQYEATLWLKEYLQQRTEFLDRYFNYDSQTKQY